MADSPTAEEHVAGRYEIELMPVIFGLYGGLLMSRVPQASDEIIDAARRLAR